MLPDRDDEFVMAKPLAVKAPANIDDMSKPASFSHVNIPASIFKDNGVSPSDCELFPVTGNSMKPTIKNGAVVLVNRTVTEVTGNNGIYIIGRSDLDGLMQVKQVSDSGSDYRITSHNTSYSEELVPKEQVKIFGKVFSQAPQSQLDEIRKLPSAGYRTPMQVVN